MASQFTLRPLLRATRPSFQIARLTTTSRAAATTTTAAKPATAKPVAKPITTAKKTYTAASKVSAAAAAIPKTSPPPAPSPASQDPSDAAVAPGLSSKTPLPDAPPTSYSNGGGSSSSSAQAAPQQQNGHLIDWTTSYYGLGTQRFSKEVVDILMQPVNPADVEVKPDGVIYLPEIKYRRILNAAFGPGGWGLVPKGEVVVGDKVVTREYALIAEGRFISQAQGENTYFNVDGLPSAVEGCKSNALMRCCKDLGIASDLWDPIFIRSFRKQYAEEVWVEHVTTKKKKIVWTRKDVPVGYPFKKTN
ncbi:mitochondrial genome maintenance protein [Colletotrichum truncatum]|uniref:Mitochondrial genome maintenance protein n=1 Tax=Colletotrichum truncatum TaxID=5467 RepID=A0ACC3YQ49_COLTU|nr:mitochondrial genome maintenance protein [Colletotrichum truncatum]KAF6796699.1 mitochondrial genome maintenance protein [Colletotrichum truncatum]